MAAKAQEKTPKIPDLPGATQRSLVHFSIGDDRMPPAVYHA